MTQEFDNYAKSYNNHLNKSLIRFGEYSEYFSEYKVRDLHYEAASRGISTQRSLKLLDFGCGIGNSILYTKKYFPNSRIVGVDVSEESVRIAQSVHGRVASFFVLDQNTLPISGGEIDIAYAMCVFHHIEPARHLDFLRRICAILRPGGLFLLYEHNPFNPITVQVVNNCPFDVNAKLVAAKAMASLCREAGFSHVNIKYRVFFPRVLSFLRVTEKLITWLPLGGQYYIVCSAPER